MRIAIIGAGFSGANLYNYLKNDNHEVTIFEKSRGAGGRCSTRYVEDKYIDHGTAFFKARNSAFIDFCKLKVEENILKEYKEDFYPLFGINKLCSSLIKEKDLLRNTKIISCSFKDEKWILQDENRKEYGNFDRLILTIPAPQIFQMDINFSEDIYKKLKDVKYDSIGTLLLYSYGEKNSINLELLKNGIFKKIIDNSLKYDYKNFTSYVLHLNEEVTRRESFKSKYEVKMFMLKALNSIFKTNLEENFHVLPHFWKYAFVSKALKEDYLYDRKNSLAFCGDYFHGEDLQSAFLSSKRVYENEFK